MKPNIKIQNIVTVKKETTKNKNNKQKTKKRIKIKY